MELFKTSESATLVDTLVSSHHFLVLSIVFHSPEQPKTVGNSSPSQCPGSLKGLASCEML